MWLGQSSYSGNLTSSISMVSLVLVFHFKVPVPSPYVLGWLFASEAKKCIMIEQYRGVPYL